MTMTVREALAELYQRYVVDLHGENVCDCDTHVSTCAPCLARAALAQEPAPPADDLVRPALERIVSRLDSSGNYSSGASADVKIIREGLEARDQRIAELTRANDQLFAHGEKMYANREAAERRAEAAEGAVAFVLTIAPPPDRLCAPCIDEEQEQRLIAIRAAIAAQEKP